VALDLAARQALHGRQLRRAADVLPLIPEAAADRFGLGTIVGEPERRHGGVNGLWRVRTDRGDFAVHAMHPRPSIVERCEATMVVELAAAGAGVRLAAPVPDPVTGRAAVRFAGTDEPVVVHEWVDAEPVHVDRCPPSLYRRLGASVALVHGLGLDADSAVPGDTLTRRTTAAEWTELAAAGRARGFPWADAVAGAAGELEAAIDELDRWNATSSDTRVVGHRDLTSQNVLDLDGVPVLIDWEDIGPIDAGDELGRTALDNLGRDGVLDDERLTAMLAGYAGVRPLPPIGPHWCALWIRGLVVFADHCARSCIDGTADASLLRLQSSVVEATVPELRRRFELVPSLVAAFERAAAP
jgi:Ser/Thr protein kinase RdoA (MazF antagonist)